MKFGKLEIDPAQNPGILDTGTWDRDAAWVAVQAVEDAYWPTLLDAAASGSPLPTNNILTPFAPSCVWHDSTLICLASLADGQQVFLAIGAQATSIPLGPPIGTKSLPGSPQPAPSSMLTLYPTDAPVIDRFFRHLAPKKGPRALGPVPRLGIGTRMTTAVWPGIWAAMARRGFAANAIQNSVRELNFLDTLLKGQPAEKNIAFGFGAIETGYTGSSYEGLWVAGVLDALKHGVRLPYGADADHIQVKRGVNGLAHAKRLLNATRYYSFYTLDVSDVLDYTALSASDAAGVDTLETKIPDPAHRRDLLAYHRQPRRSNGFDYQPDDATLGRLVGKYWIALDAVVEMYKHICDLKDGLSFDLELSIDEHPNDVPTFDCLTSETELVFVLLEAQRRGVPLTHVAPNFGVEKGTDYRGADGLSGFEARARSLCRIAEEFGVMADFHSGDDLSAAARQAIGRATAGRNHFKVSPNLQLLFGEVLADHHPGLFRRWWQDALAYAQRESAAGSAFASDCIQQADLDKPSPHDALFHNFSFAFVGRRDANGQFICREEFYDLSPAFNRAYQTCITEYLLELADDLFPQLHLGKE
ncbi:MAG: hypothetical protein KBG20_13915 [Caldilineaceae bacterium]|nr:hypothetical protein [Caldilineaceae bacterium]MBP8123064.1 hypothetical protein [Caldilineaceae bacterium]MBP9073397.1 hypothetical protein [Caldilineaceae bacterium]